ncbi:MAG: M20 family metallopeptidase [Actinomycetota bacterium]|nr:M20 family metallopeptidase [Actinomycetota bacterium]
MTELDSQATAGVKERVRRRLSTDARSLVALSHRIHAHPELAYEEVLAAEWVATALEDGGMRVERGAHGLPTALRATAGSAGPNVVLCAEYDALPGIGHACGHNVIAASAVGAGLALAGLAEDLGIRVTVLGTPAEESGGGKVDLLRAGAFDDAAVAMMVHPWTSEHVEFPTLAWARVEIAYHGKEAHASVSPQRGLNALDAVNLSYMAVAALRQHIHHTDRVHGIINLGGDAPNVVPKLTRATYFVRSATAEVLEGLKERVLRCFEAGAVATGCDLEVRWLGNDYDAMTANRALGAVYEANLRSLGRSAVPVGILEAGGGSTDMGNVSRAVPSLHPTMSLDSLPAVNHQVEFAAHSVSAAADRAVLDAALALAWTAVDLATVPGALQQVRDEFEQPGMGSP